MTINKLIEQLCDADKRNSSKKLQKLAKVVIVNNVSDWYVTNTQNNNKV